MRALHARKPGARLLLQSILPTSEPARDREVVLPVNARLAALAASPEFAPFTVWPGPVNTTGSQRVATRNGPHFVAKPRRGPTPASFRASLGPFLDGNALASRSVNRP
jgi:hypothetical protein